MKISNIIVHGNYYFIILSCIYFVVIVIISKKKKIKMNSHNSKKFEITQSIDHSKSLLSNLFHMLYDAYVAANTYTQSSMHDEKSQALCVLKIC